jgi:phosphoserine phosphatase
MTIHDGVITGTVKKPILGRESKAQILTRYCREHALAAGDAAAIGDGANDMAVLQAAGMGVAFAGKDVLRAAIDLQLNHTDLTGLLFLQGYRKADFVSGEAG